MTVKLGFVTAQKQSLLLQQSVSLLRMSSQDLSEFLLETAKENPVLSVEYPRRRLFIRNSTTDVLESMAGEEQLSLHAHVMAELDTLIAQGGLLAKIIVGLIEELEPSGWLGAFVPAIAAKLGIPEQHVEAVLRLVQRRVEPSGLFAQTLQDCLFLQLEARGELSDEMCAVLEHLGVLEKHGVATLARKADISEDVAHECIATIRRLDPKPGAAFRVGEAPIREPDATVLRGPDGWKVVFNSATEPVVTIAQLPGATERSEDLARMIKEARALKQAMDMRLSATRRVVIELIRQQQAYFDEGRQALKILSMADLATATGFHASTVSRVLNGYTIEGPHGVIAARDLCARAASQTLGGCSRPQVMERLRIILAKEDSRNPIRDARLKELLLADGIAISRRMVAKYRALCGFASAATRRDRGCDRL